MIIKSRNGVDRNLDKLDENTYLIYGESKFTRCNASTEKGLTFIDYEGGPFIAIESQLFNTNRLIKSIEHFECDKPNCYKIEVYEEN